MAARNRRLAKGLPALLAAVLVVAALSVLPRWTSAYVHSFVIALLTFVILAESWNLFSGFTGYISLGHGVFFGVGVYAFALTAKMHVPMPVALLSGGVFAAALAALFGAIFLRVKIKIAYFALITLGLNEIVARVIENNAILGGAQGTTTPLLPNPLIAYYYLLVLAVVMVIVAYLVQHSKLGLGLRAIRADEVAAEVSGVNAFHHKFAVFLLSAVFPGLTGAMNVWYWSYTEPDTAFNIVRSFEMIIMTLFGGVGTIVGPVVGATVMGVLAEILSTSFPFLHAMIFGLLVVLIVVFRPGGLLEFARRVRVGASSWRPAPGPGTPR